MSELADLTERLRASATERIDAARATTAQRRARRAEIRTRLQQARLHGLRARYATKQANPADRHDRD